MGNPKKAKDFKYLYGPVSSWRLGSSLGIDLISRDKKVCVFDCVYCQLTGTSAKTRKRKIFVPTEKIVEEIKMLTPDLSIDYITFSGRGEPTLAKNLGEIIRQIRILRKERIAVITNSALMWDKSIRAELALSDFVMAKLDASNQKSFEKINGPVEGIRFVDVYEGIKSFHKEYDTKLAVQTMFFGMNKNEYKKLAELSFEIDPDEIQINTPLRPCGVKPLSKEEIADIKGYFIEYGKGIDSHVKIVSVYDAEHKDVAPLSREETLRRRGKID
jgi:wyosine [tRNA(Phe)-imidazoG37] synthetase (radical SAM superfamily)